MGKIRDSYSWRNEGTNKSGIKWVRHVECKDEIMKCNFGWKLKRPLASPGCRCGAIKWLTYKKKSNVWRRGLDRTGSGKGSVVMNHKHSVIQRSVCETTYCWTEPEPEPEPAQALSLADTALANNLKLKQIQKGWLHARTSTRAAFLWAYARAGGKGEQAKRS
jgi:hypothetical protein